MSGYELVLERLEDEGLDSGPYTQGMWRCPSHDDTRASLSMKEGDDGHALVYCHAGCPTKDVMESLGLRMSDLFTDSKGGVVVDTYTYTDEEGRPLFRVVRFDPKGFTQQRWEDDEWKYGLESVRRVLYRLPEVLAAVAAGELVYLVEGEKDADNLRSQGVMGTTVCGGAGGIGHTDLSCLAGARVVCVPDQDDAGRLWLQRVRAALPDTAGVSVRVPLRGKDVTDHLLAGHGIDDLVSQHSDAVFEPWDPWSYEAPVDEWLLKPYVPRASRVLLHGESGALKTLWTMWLADKLAHSGERVAFMSTEMNKGQAAKRFQRFEPTPNLSVYGRFMLGLDLETAIRCFEGFSLMVVDSWSSTQGDIGSNDNDAISLLDTEFLQPLIAATGMSVLITDNTGKDSVTDKGDKVKQTFARGASRKRDIQEVELWFSRPDKANNFRTKIECTKMRLDLAIPRPLVVETPQDRIEFYVVEKNLMTTQPMWTSLAVDGDITGLGVPPSAQDQKTDDPFAALRMLREKGRRR